MTGRCSWREGARPGECGGGEARGDDFAVGAGHGVCHCRGIKESAVGRCGDGIPGEVAVRWPMRASHWQEPRAPALAHEAFSLCLGDVPASLETVAMNLVMPDAARWRLCHLSPLRLLCLMQRSLRRRSPPCKRMSGPNGVPSKRVVALSL